MDGLTVRAVCLYTQLERCLALPQRSPELVPHAPEVSAGAHLSTSQNRMLNTAGILDADAETASAALPGCEHFLLLPCAGETR